MTAFRKFGTKFGKNSVWKLSRHENGDFWKIANLAKFQKFGPKIRKIVNPAMF